MISRVLVRLLFAALLGACAAPAFAQVGVSISIGQPGFYGQINLGDAAGPPPQLVYSQPVIVQPAPEYAEAPPIYLHVPPGHERHWRKHCAEYHACGRRVFFVRDDWYNREYVPRWQREHGDHEHGDHEHGDHGRGDHEGDHDRGRGHDHDDHDHGHGHDEDHHDDR